MARITVVILLLWSMFSSVAGLRNTAQVHNRTHLEKRFTRMVQEEKEAKGKEVDPKEKCRKATYKTVSLYDFVYKHNCFPAGWKELLALKLVQKDISEISPLLLKEAEKYQIEPPMPNMFRAFTVPLDKVRVVIIGQDPVPEAGQATGPAFSLKTGQDPRKSVPTVFNMLVELKVEGVDVDLSNGDLTPWVDQGVLLLNAALTVKQGPSKYMAGSHQYLWIDFTQLLVEYISK
ncbi:uracil-DNA glycosylase-like [Oculina patagonica]